ncbi:MAG: transglutaminase-like domain-containing protein, partial [Acidimicrobiales bacterium]
MPPSRLPAAIITGALVLAVTLAVGTGLPLARMRPPVDLRADLAVPVDLASTANPQSVHVVGLTGPWVPTTGVPTGVVPADLAFDPATSVLLAEPSAKGRTFALTDRLVKPGVTGLFNQSGVGGGNQVGQLTSVATCTPPALLALAQSTVAGEIRPDQEAARIQLALSSGPDHYRLNPGGLPGSSCARLRQFVTTRRGTAEQFATAFVLMARSVGLPARLAVGFRPGAIDGASGTTVVTGADATVWPEVDFSRIGWVQFNPLPSGRGSGPAPAGRTSSVTTVPSPVNGVIGTIDSQGALTVPANSASTTPPAAVLRRSSAPWWWLVVPVVVVAGAGV